MRKKERHLEQLQDQTTLFFKVSLSTSASCLLFALIAWFLLDMQGVVPAMLLGFALSNSLNLWLHRSHKNLKVTYHITQFLALIGAVSVVLYSGGINSPFIFTLALVVFSGYVQAPRYGRIYLTLSMLILVLVYSQSLSEYSIAENTVPEGSRDAFAFLSILLALFLLGGVFGYQLMETQHRLYRTKSKMEKRMKEKEMLLKEVHHRVKNNLQTVSSLLRMQSRGVEDPYIQNLIQSSQNRVVCMAMVHEMLYMRDDLAKIEYRSYVQDLGDYLVKSIKGPESNIRLNIDIPDIELGIDTAIPLGLLINEAVTNALKYGFKDQDSGEISIVLQQEDQKEYVLHIGDNGVGFAENVSHTTTKSLGLKLIHNLTRQLKGSVIRDLSKQGTNYIIRFEEISQAPFHTLA
ncbi:sensor histidine kinase [Robiginitalea sp. M366]|uniref:sensor histidine kinase n=1 Tax=Robiginitalea aestuariiviva TaxID=3036903 RepID=UPI00240DCB52|nr:sensor histidine kinase [Robiginitalea aestuariiviva]MDG1572399.1 sensor histidine kinase [Robiginitalea aestuariiviva]